MPAAAPDSRDRLIIALDFPDASSALNLVDRLDGACSWFKVGLELFLAAGPPLVSDLRDRGFNVFLDLKLHDIPNTVAGAVRSVSPLGASLLTVHAGGGAAMLQAAAEAAAAVPNSPRLIAVTVLTSMDAAQLTATGVNGSVLEQVERLAHLSLTCGIGGLVCSPQEVAHLRTTVGDSPLLVVPGIRPDGSKPGDQVRIATPAEALTAGASVLVVGRPVTQAADPAAAFQAMLSSLPALAPVSGASPKDR